MGLTQVAKTIKELRESKHLSQAELAVELKITRTAVSQIENGSRKVCGDELVSLAEVFGVTTDYILGLEKEPEVMLAREKQDNYSAMRISVPAIKKDKFKQVLLYLLEKCAGKPNIGETAIFKLLYFIDFNFYELYEMQMTGASYRKLKFGPVPVEFAKITSEMEKKKELKTIKDNYYGYPQTRYFPLIKPDLNILKASEKVVIDKVVDLFSDWSAKELSDYSHDDIPWKATKSNDVIDY